MIRRWFALWALFFSGMLAGCGPADPSDPGDSAEPGPGEEGLVVLSGELQVAIVTYDDGRAGKEYVLAYREDESTRLDLSRVAVPELSSGDRVVVRGMPVEGAFLVETLWVEPNDDDALGDVPAETKLVNPVRTTAKVAVLMVHWGSPDSLTRDSMRTKVFTGSNSTKSFYWENSYGQFDMVGDVFGWYSISNPGCDTSAISSRARTAARNAGVDIDSYHQVMYYFPKTSACGWSGYAFLGLPSKPARDSFYNGSSNCVVLAQELLHNFGAMHSRSYDCGSAPIAASGCTYSEYGDPFDPMGGGCYHINAYQKAAMGWYGGCNDVTTSVSATFDVVPTQVASDGIQSLRVPMSASLCPSGFSSCYYTVEYRQPVGAIEGGYSASSSVYNGVLIHVTAPVNFTGLSQTRQTYTYLLDMNPGTSTFGDAALGNGKSWADPSGIRFSVLSTSPAGAKVRVELPGGGSGTPRCIDGSSPGGTPPPSDVTAPTVTLVSPDHDATVAPSSAVDVVADVSDDVGVAKAELVWTNGGSSWTVGCDTATSPFACTKSGARYTWTVTLGAAGTRTWAIKGHDTSGNVTTSATRTLNVASAPPPPPPPADTTPPSVELVSPAAGAVFPPSSALSVVTRVTDAGGVAKVELLWTSGSQSWTTNCASPASPFTCSASGDTYTFGVTVGAAGERTFSVRATDSAGNVTTTPVRSITVGTAPPADAPPVVVQVSPANGGTAKASSTIQVVARATDDASVAKVELLWFKDSTSWTIDCNVPQQYFSCSRSGDTYTYSVQVGTGTRTWRVRATDSTGQVTTSDLWTVRLQ